MSKKTDFVITVTRRVDKCGHCPARYAGTCTEAMGPRGVLKFKSDNDLFPIGCPHATNPQKKDDSVIQNQAVEWVQDIVKTGVMSLLRCDSCDTDIDEECPICDAKMEASDSLICLQHEDHCHEKCLMRELKRMADPKEDKELDGEDCEICGEPSVQTSLPQIICSGCAKRVHDLLKEDFKNTIED